MWVFLFSFAAIPVSIAVRILYAQKLSVVDYGLFYGFFAFLGMFEFLRDWGLRNAAAYFTNKYVVKKDNRKIKTLYFINHFVPFVLSLIIAGLLFLFKGVIVTHVYKNEGHINFIFNFLLIYWVLAVFYRTNTTFFNAYSQQQIPKAIEFISLSLIFVSSFFLLFFFESYKVPVISYIGVFAFLSIVSTYWFFVKHRDVFEAKMYVKKDLFKEVITYANAIFIGGLSSLVLTQTDSFLLQIFSGATNVALYTTGFSAANLITAFTTPITIIFYPIFMRYWHHKNKKVLTKVLNLILNNILLVLLPISLFFFVFAKQIILLMFGAKFAASTIVLQVFAFTFILNALALFFLMCLRSFGKPKACSKVIVIGGVSNIILDLILIPKFELMGAIVATSICYVIMLIAAGTIVNKDIKIRPSPSKNLKIIISSIMFTLTYVVVKDYVLLFSFGNQTINTISNNIIVFIISISVYAIFLVMLKVVDKNMIMTLKNIVIKKK